jgi:hypothetical protein
MSRYGSSKLGKISWSAVTKTCDSDPDRPEIRAYGTHPAWWKPDATAEELMAALDEWTRPTVLWFQAETTVKCGSERGSATEGRPS